MREIQKATIVCLSLLLYSLTSNAQAERQDVQESFQITIEKFSDKNVQLTCSTGCAWKELQFAVQEKAMAQGINLYGMTGINRAIETTNDALADFLFTLKFEKDSVLLKGVKGTVWKDLSFTLKRNKSQKINHLGMIE